MSDTSSSFHNKLHLEALFINCRLNIHLLYTPQSTNLQQQPTVTTSLLLLPLSVVDESSLARRLVHSQLATPGYSDVTEHISFRLGMLFDDLSSSNSSSGGGSGSGSSSSITSSLLSLLPSSIGIPSSGNVSAVGINPTDDVKVKVQVHGSAALHIVDSRLAVDLSVALTINHRSDIHVNKSQGVEGGVGEGMGERDDQKLGMEKLASLREAIVSVESLAVLAPALHAEVQNIRLPSLCNLCNPLYYTVLNRIRCYMCCRLCFVIYVQPSQVPDKVSRNTFVAYDLNPLPPTLPPAPPPRLLLLSRPSVMR